MDLDADAPLGFSSLYLLSNHLREPEAANRDDFDRLLNDLDRLFVLLSEAFEAVNQLGVGVGLVDPKNVLYYFDREERMRLVLPDLFFWNQAVGDPPSFVSSRSEFTGLWMDYDPSVNRMPVFETEREQIDFVDRFLAESKSDTSRDARTLARLVAWSVTGVCGAVGAVSNGRSGAIWPVLKRADGESQEGEITSALELGHEIRGVTKSPSSVIRSPEPLQRSQNTVEVRRNRLWPALFLLLLAGLLPTLAYCFLDVPPPPEPPVKYAICEACEATSKVHALLRSEQAPLIARFLEVYGDDPFSQEPTEVVFPKQLYGQAITQELLQQQAELLAKQVKVLDKLYNRLCKSGKPRKAELACLQLEAERVERAFGTHVHVLGVQMDPDVNELSEPVVLVGEANEIYKELCSKKYFLPSGQRPWYPKYSELLLTTGVGK
jgi:hypothetical protein